LPFFAEQLTGIEPEVEATPGFGEVPVPSVESVTAPQDTQAFSDILKPFGLSPELEAETRASAASLSGSMLRVEEAEFQRGLDQQIRTIEATAPIESKFAIEQAVDQFNELLPLRTKFEEKMALMRHNFRLQEINAQQTGSPSPGDTFGALILSTAQDVALDPTIAELPPTEWKMHVLARVRRQWFELGLELPALGTIKESLNEAARFWHRGLKDLSKKEEELDAKAALEAALNDPSLNPPANE
jgi:hypothetical protein